MQVVHPCVRWEGPGSAFESSSAGAGAVWKSGIFQNPMCLREFEKWDPDISVIFRNPVFLREFETWGLDMIPKCRISNNKDDGSIQNGLTSR